MKVGWGNTRISNYVLRYTSILVHNMITWMSIDTKQRFAVSFIELFYQSRNWTLKYVPVDLVPEYVHEHHELVTVSLSHAMVH